MIKFLIQASYTKEGAEALLKADSGTNRRATTDAMLKSLGGKMESFYYVSNCDAWVICELPDFASVSAIALKIKASGLGTITSTVLLTPEEVDKAAKLDLTYAGPGSQKLSKKADEKRKTDDKSKIKKDKKRK